MCVYENGMRDLTLGFEMCHARKFVPLSVSSLNFDYYLSISETIKNKENKKHLDFTRSKFTMTHKKAKANKHKILTIYYSMI
jgi:hypothetical protein